MAVDNIQSQNFRRKRFILRTWHVVVAIAMIIIVAVVAFSAYFVWNRWDRYDDTQGIQGQWYVFGTDVPIQITQDVLDFNADTSYHYTIDTENKTITFTLGKMEGTAHYCFFEDRQVLVLIDGEDFTRWGTAADDLIISLQQFAELSAGRIPLYPSGEGVIVLSRTPDKYGWGSYSYAYQSDQGVSDKKANSSQPEANANKGTDTENEQSTENTTPTSGEDDSVNAPNDSPAPETSKDSEDQQQTNDPFASVSDTPADRANNE